MVARHAALRSAPGELVPGTVRVISARFDYWPAAARDARGVLDDRERAYVSRYALGRDYHKLVRANYVADATVFVGEWLTQLPVWRTHLRSPYFVVRNGADTGNLVNIDGLTTRHDHNCALRGDDRVICWGDGGYGRLGNGDDDPEPLPVLVQS